MVILLFLAGLVVIAEGALELSREVASQEPAHGVDLAIPAAECTFGAVIVAGLLLSFGAHPRTKSTAATNSFKAMKGLMFLAGIVLFLGGALQIIATKDFIEQVALAVVSLLFLVTPLCLHFTRR